MVDVIQGDQGFLFLGGRDSNDIIRQHTGGLNISHLIPAIKYTHLARAAYLRLFHGADYLHVICPNKETVAAELMAHEAIYEEHGPTPVRQYFLAWPGAEIHTLFDPSAFLNYQERRLYYKTDTHWTFRGAKHYLEIVMRRLGYEERLRQLEAMELRIDDLPFVGDLAVHLGHPGEVQEHILPKFRNGAQVFHNHIPTEGRVFHFMNSSALGRALMIMDSTGSWMMNFMAELFSEVLAVHIGDLDLRLIDRYRPTVVLFVQAERFFPRSPRDGVDWSEIIRSNEARKNATASAVEYLSRLQYF